MTTDHAAASRQQQFLEVIDRDEAERRFQAALRLAPLGEECIPLELAWGRVLSRDVVSPVDVPSFDRSNVDGFAVRAADTYGAAEETPRRLRLLDEVIATAVVPQSRVMADTAVPIATGGMVPRGADAVVMVEHTDVDHQQLLVTKSVSPGAGISFAGTDIGAGETVLRRSDLLTSRETGVLAAIGMGCVHVWKRPCVAILSTGDEIIPPGQPMRPGCVYDSNARMLADAVRELGAEPLLQGIVPDDADQLEAAVALALTQADVVLLSGGTSKGTGDLSYRIVSRLTDPGVVAHGVALKPGKPICLAASQGKPVVVLPGFPTSAIFTFHEFVAPVIRRLAGRSHQRADEVVARLAVQVNSEIGRTEYLLVGLVAAPESEVSATRLTAYPMGKGSGSVTAFSRATALSRSVVTKKWRWPASWSRCSGWAVTWRLPILWSSAATASGSIGCSVSCTNRDFARSFWPPVRLPGCMPRSAGSATWRESTCAIRSAANTTPRMSHPTWS